jgi:uncharacterized coiled-coil protein SlyX
MESSENFTDTLIKTLEIENAIQKTRIKELEYALSTMQRELNEHKSKYMYTNNSKESNDNNLLLG